MEKYLKLNLSYCGMQMCYYAVCAALGGYASVYMLSKGFTNSVIGIALSVINIASIIIQSTLSSFCDKHEKIDLRNVLVVIAVAVAILALAIHFCGSGSALLLCLFISVYTVSQTMAPIINSLAFTFEKYGITINFGLARGMGSATYAIGSLILGYVTEFYGVDILPMIYMTFCLLQIFAVKFYMAPKKVKREYEVKEKAQGDGLEKKKESQLSFFGFMKKYKSFTIFCLGSTMVFFTHIIITNYTIQIIMPLGGTESMMGRAVFLGCIMELPAMALFETFRKRFGARNLLIFAMVCFLLKHTLTMMATSMTMLYMVQLLQFFGFGTFFPASVYYANKVVDACDTVKAQTMVLFSYTISSIYASFIGGFLLDLVGVKRLLAVGIAFSIAGLIVCTMSTSDDR